LASAIFSLAALALLGWVTLPWWAASHTPAPLRWHVRAVVDIAEKQTIQAEQLEFSLGRWTATSEEFVSARNVEGRKARFDIKSGTPLMELPPSDRTGGGLVRPDELSR
jgi:hypothetical protein